MTRRVLRLKQVQAQTGLSRSTIIALQQRGIFPQSIKIRRDTAAESLDLGAPAGNALDCAGTGAFTALESAAFNAGAPFVAQASRWPAATLSRDAAGAAAISSVSSTPRNRKSSSGLSSSRLPTPERTAAACLHSVAPSPHSHDATISPGCGSTPLSRSVRIEAALAHVVRNQTEAAYARSDLFERRRRLMDDWMRYLDRPCRQAATTPAAG